MTGSLGRDEGSPKLGCLAPEDLDAAVAVNFTLLCTRHFSYSILKTYKVLCKARYTVTVGCVAQLVERRSLTGELSLSCARPAADG